MSEALDIEPFSLDGYQIVVEWSRRDDDPPTDDPLGQYADLIKGEALELISQHGPGLIFLMPKEFDESIARTGGLEQYPTLTAGAAEEIGDLFWFGSRVSTHLGYSVRELCADSLSRHTGEDYSGIKNFNDIQDVLAAKGDQIKVLSEFGLTGGDGDDEDRYTTLAEDPYYVFMRVTHRLTRALEKGEKDVSPRSIAELEPVADINTALGDYMNTLAYIAHNRLGWSVEDMVRANIQKNSKPATVADSA